MREKNRDQWEIDFDRQQRLLWHVMQERDEAMNMLAAILKKQGPVYLSVEAEQERLTGKIVRDKDCTTSMIRFAYVEGNDD